MGLFTSLVMTGAMAGQQISSGIASSNEAKYNASIYGQQATLIENQKGLEGYQYNKAKGQLIGKTTARTAKAGLEMSGSPMAVMVDNLTQLELDKSIGQYNLEVQKRFSQSTADMYKRKAKTAMNSSISNAFSTILMGGFDAGMSSGMFSTTRSALQTSNSAMVRRLNGSVQRVPTRSYRF